MIDRPLRAVKDVLLPPLAEPILDWLENRTLCLVVGSGSSKDLGLPSWKELAMGLAAAGKLDPEKLKDWQDLPFLIDLLGGDTGELRRRARKLIFGNLAKNWVAGQDYPAAAIWELANLAILTACHTRDRAWHVVTYNFDTTLEEAIHALGYRAISLVPRGHTLHEVIPPSYGPVSSIHFRFPRRDPVRVLHAHGLLVREEDSGVESHDALTVSASDYDRRLGLYSDVSNRAQFGSFFGLNCFFYGWSFQDYAFRMNLSFSADMTELQPEYLARPRHIALMISPQSDDYTENEMDRRLDQWLLRHRVVRGGRRSFAQHHRFLRRLIQEARRRGWMR